MTKRNVLFAITWPEIEGTMLDRVRFSYDLVAKELSNEGVTCFISYSGDTVERETTQFMRKCTLFLFDSKFCEFVLENNVGVVVIIDPPKRFWLNQLKLRLNGVKFVWYSRYGFHEHFVPHRPKQILKYLFHRLNIWSNYWAISEDIKKNLNVREKVPLSKLTLIRNGIDSFSFTPNDRTEAATGKNSFRVLYVAQNRPEKRLVFFIEVANLFISRNPDVNVEFIHLGKGDIEPLKKRVIDLGIDDKVRFEGVTNRVKEYMKSSDVYLHVSSKEGICNAISEAMLMELPVICAKIGGNVEQVIDGETGYLLYKDSRSEFVEKLELYLNNTELGSTHGKAGRNHIKKNFSVHNQVKGIAKSIVKLLS